MGRSNHVKRFELDGMHFDVYPKMLVLFRKAGWELVFQRFNKYNLSWCQDFIYSFNGYTSRIRTLQFPVTEESIVGATSFPTEGERWFKQQRLQNVDLNFFLKEDCQNQDCKVWVLQNMLNLEWSTTLEIVHLLFTCEGRYSKACLYHMRFLFHLASFNKMDLPYFLHQSLLNMCTKIKTIPNLQPYYIFHL